MKKIILGVASVLLSATLLCSCSTPVVKQVEKDPTKEVFKAVNSTLDNVVSENEVLGIVTSALEKGSVLVDLPDEVGPEANLKIYNDTEKLQSALFLSGFVVDETEIDFNFYADDSVVAVESEKYLGDGAYGIDFKTLYEDLSTWEMWEAAGTTFEEFDELYGEQVKSFCDYLTNPEKIEEINKAELIKLVKKLDACVTEVKSTAKNDTKAVVVKYDFDTEDVNEIINTLNSWYIKNVEAVLPDVEEYDIDTAEAYFNSIGLKDYNLSLCVYLDEDMKNIVSVEVSGNATESLHDLSKISALTDDMTEEDIPTKDTPVSFNLVYDLINDNKCKLTSTSVHGDNIYTTTVEFEKNDTEEKTEYKVIASAGEDTEEMSIVFNKIDKTFKLTDSGSKFSVNGSYNNTGNAVAISVDSFNFDETEEVKIGVGVTFEKDAKTEFPESYTKITDMSMEELEAILAPIVVTAEPQVLDDLNY